MNKLKEVRSWFKWDYRAREDEKISKMMRKEQYEGYGLFVAIIEYLHENDGKLNIDDLSYSIRCSDNDKLYRILNDYNLFYKNKNDETYGCNRVDEQLKDRKEKSILAAKNANKRWKK